MVKLLGLIDIFAAVLLLSIAFGIVIPASILIIIPSFLLVKASIYIADIGSITDVVIAILVVLSFFMILPFWILFAGAILMGIKGLMSLAA